MLLMAALFVWTYVLQRVLMSQIVPVSSQDNIGPLNGESIIEAGRARDVQIKKVPRRGAIFDHRRRQFLVSTRDFQARDLDTIWRACHELHHQYQTSALWTMIFRLKILGESVFAAGGIAVVVAAWLGSPLSPNAIWALSAIGALSYFAGDYFPEVDAIINTPNRIKHDGELFEPLSESTISTKIWNDLLRYFFATIVMILGFAVAIAAWAFFWYGG